MKSFLTLLLLTLSIFANIPQGTYDARDRCIAKTTSEGAATHHIDPKPPRWSRDP